MSLDKRQSWPFHPKEVSASRINTYLSCGEQFRMKYIENLPEQRSGSAALFGNVIHYAFEHWAMDRSQDLVTLMSKAWEHESKGTSVCDFIIAYKQMAPRVLRAEKKAADEFLERNGRETKAVRMTAAFKKSKAAKDENALVAEWLPRLQKESPWGFTDRDPLPKLYNESLILAKRYARKWGHLPNALSTEFSFNVKWHDFHLRGFVDSIELMVDKDTGEVIAPLVVDYKSYAKEPAEMKDWRQMVMYDVAFRELAKTGAQPFYDLWEEYESVIVCIDYPRLLTRKYWNITEKDHERLRIELNMYNDAVQAGIFLPAEKGRNPDFCPYPDQCCLKTKGEGLSPQVDYEQ